MTASRNHVASLIEKRRELARLIVTLQEQLDEHWADLAHLDGVLRLLGKDLDPRHDPPKAPLPPRAIFRAERAVAACPHHGAHRKRTNQH